MPWHVSAVSVVRITALSFACGGRAEGFEGGLVVCFAESLSCERRTIELSIENHHCKFFLSG